MAADHASALKRSLQSMNEYKERKGLVKPVSYKDKYLAYHESTSYSAVRLRKSQESSLQPTSRHRMKRVTESVSTIKDS